MLKPIIYKNLKLSDKFNAAFPDNRVPSGFIDKTKTRLGITYTNFHDNRHTITVIPSTAIIDDAVTDYPYLDLFPVSEGVTVKHIEDYLRDESVQIKRLVPTPESFGKIITAARNIGKLNWLYKNVFLYLDEVHCYATEAFRNDILTPFEYVWEFNKHNNLAMGSATPFWFSDPSIKAMQHYKIRFEEKFGTINIVNYYDPKAVLYDMLGHPERFPGNVHIFFNSVTESGEAIRATGLQDVAILCRDDEQNMVNLEEASVFFKSKPLKEDYKKFNFYSCKYNDGWDLKDDETATIILVTDVHIPHSLIGIPFKGFQAVGRMKVTPHKIFHITNDFNITGMRGFKTIQQKWLYNAEAHIGFYNSHITNCDRDAMEDNGLLGKLIKPFANFEGSKANLHFNGLDQLICSEYCKEHYNNADAIEQTWQSVNYNTVRENFDVAPIMRARKSQADINKQVIERYEEVQANPERYAYKGTSVNLKKYKTEFQLLLDAYKILGKEKIEELKYNDNAMKQALIETSNRNAEAKLRLMLIDEFKLGKRYTNKEIKDKLKEFYELLDIKNPNGTIKVAMASQLSELGLFMLHDCKVKLPAGGTKPGVEIKKVHYCLKMAA